MLGLGFFSAGVAMIYWQGVLPLLGAIREKPRGEYSIKLIIFGEFYHQRRHVCSAAGTDPIEER